MVLGALQALMETPLYTATVRLQIDRNVAKVVEGGNVTPIETQDYEFLRTQYELLQGRAIAQRVVSALKLGEDKDFLERSHFSLLGAVKGVVKLVTSPSYHSHADTKTDRERGAVGRVIANRKMRPVSGSRLVDLTYSDPDPARAQKVAAAFASAFIASNLDKRFEANAYAKTFLEDQLKQLKLKLEASGKRLLKFAENEQIIIDSDKTSIAESNLAAANAELGKLVAERIKNEQLWKQVEAADAINLPQLLSNKVIEGLREKRNQLVTEYQEKLETFKAGYPAMVQIKKKIAEIRAAAEQRGHDDQGVLQGGLRELGGPGKTNAGADRVPAGRGPRPAEEEHRVQHPQARGGHEPLSLRGAAAALQGSRRCERRRRQQRVRGRPGGIAETAVLPARVA